jgi:SH3-like domain-containing protein
MTQSVPAPITNAAIAAAYDAAMCSAVIQSIRWLRRDIVSVQINGREQTARVTVLTVDGVREAVRKCLDQHCTVEAVATVALAEVSK